MFIAFIILAGLCLFFAFKTKKMLYLNHSCNRLHRLFYRPNRFSTPTIYRYCQIYFQLTIIHLQVLCTLTVIRKC